MKQINLAMLLIAAGLFLPACVWAQELTDPAPISDETEQCIDCHQAYTPGIVADWKASLHARVSPKKGLTREELSRRVSSQEVPEDLLEVGGTKQGRRDLANKTGIGENIILEWVNMADLFRIKGIGEEYSQLLKEAGVSTVVELARRNPENLHTAIIGVNKAKNLVRRPPSLTQIEDWIEKAKILPRRVDY